MKNKKLKTVFIGTPDFGERALLALIDSKEFEILAAITQPDKKVGRKQTLTPPPIKVLAEKNNIPVFQPDKIKNIDFNIDYNIDYLDLIVVIAYAQIIPKHILSFPKYGCINVHGSLLPYCRGASCVQGPILDGEKESGITIMKMDKGLDTGPVIAQHKISLVKNETTGSLFEKLSILAEQKIVTTLLDYVHGKLEPKKQNEVKACYSRTLNRKDGQINWSWSAEKIERFVRAMQPWPKAFSFLPDRKKIIFHKVSAEFIDTTFEPGAIFNKNNNLVINAKNRALIIKKLQIEGKKPISGEEFLRGHSKYLNTSLK